MLLGILHFWKKGICTCDKLWYFFVRYVGNLDPALTEDLIITLFSQIGDCKGCKIIHEVGMNYCFHMSGVAFLKNPKYGLVVLSMEKAMLPKVIRDLKSLSKLDIFSKTGPKSWQSCTFCVNEIHFKNFESILEFWAMEYVQCICVQWSLRIKTPSVCKTSFDFKLKTAHNWFDTTSIFSV